MSIVMKTIFYRPVIRYAAGDIGFLNMSFWMGVRFLILALAIAWAAGITAMDQGVFEQDGNRPDPSIAAKAKQNAEAKAYKGKADMTAAEYRASLK